MGPILRFKTKRIVVILVFIATITTLVGPYIFVHFPRTCIPYVDPIHQTGRPISSSPSTSTATDNNNYNSIHGYQDPRIIILSGQVCTNPDPNSKCRQLGQVSHHNRREYIAHHQGRYDLWDTNIAHYFEQVKAVGAVPAWAKIKMIKDELAKDEHDWIFWMDTDALIANMDIRLEQFIDNRHPLIVTKDWYCLNAGVFFIKNDDWSREFIDLVWSKMGPYDHEQDWMIATLERHPELKEQEKVKYLPQCSFNSYWHMKKLYEMFRPGDFMVHWAAFNWDVQSFKDWQQLRYFKVPSLRSA
ncbi:glycosyltransferase family 34 protein [Linnemannia elongata AG-77]|uniref:Glycosyltransferase family 34 protein n=1 Tax=Linnemannia elongata AG-77 TaxID=1314771 RepID=A0A197JUD6_9FUNG|nr:glycosyltransferase family 34 protein [Linnemannia elongata AG-77]